MERRVAVVARAEQQHMPIQFIHARQRRALTQPIVELMPLDDALGLRATRRKRDQRMRATDRAGPGAKRLDDTPHPTESASRGDQMLAYVHRA